MSNGVVEMKNSSGMKQDLEQQQSSDLQQPQPQRRLRGFAAAAAASAAGELAAAPKGRKEREKEKERTKLRERHRRSITSRMLAGLRQYGNFPLPARPDMNDVLAALAREAGWTVEADGTTYRPSPPPGQLAPMPIRSVEGPLCATSLKNCSMKASDSQSSVPRIDESSSPASLGSIVVEEKDIKNNKYANVSPINSPECLEADPGMKWLAHATDEKDAPDFLILAGAWRKKATACPTSESRVKDLRLMMGVHLGEHENDFTGTAYIPVYVILPAGIINSFCQLVDPEGIQQELRHLKSLNVDGVVVDCWWGIVEGWSPRKYLWSGYRDLFNIIREFQLKLQVVMAFHECGGNGSGDMPIPLPKWVMEIGKDNQDIFFTDREGRRNTECLSWGIDKERVLKGRTGIEVYFDFMRSFRMEFDDLFAEGLISGVEIGLGASGELKYPSFAERMGWRYPGIGEFQCYDKYLQQSLRRAAKLRGHSFWARGPDNAGQYNSRPHETGFFCERGDYDSYYGRFFLHWYAQTLIDHADHVLSLANLAFDDTQIIVKIPAVYWWYRTSGHAAELTAGFYNPTNQEGYSPIFDILKKHSAAPKFVCSGLQVHAQEHIEALADLEALSWQVLNSAWDRGLTVAGQNALPCYDREGYSKILETSKPRNHPDRRHMSFFAYQQLSPASMQRDQCISELDYFIKCMHGEATADHEA